MLQDGKHRSLTLIGNRIYFFSNRRGCWYCDRTSGRWVKVVRFERDMLQYHVSVLVQDKIYIVSGPTLRRRMIGFDPVTKELESLRAPLIASDEWGKIALVYVPWRDEVILIWSFTYVFPLSLQLHNENVKNQTEQFVYNGYQLLFVQDSAVAELYTCVQYLPAVMEAYVF